MAPKTNDCFFNLEFVLEANVRQLLVNQREQAVKEQAMAKMLKN